MAKISNLWRLPSSFPNVSFNQGLTDHRSKVIDTKWKRDRLNDRQGAKKKIKHCWKKKIFFNKELYNYIILKLYKQAQWLVTLWRTKWLIEPQTSSKGGFVPKKIPLPNNPKRIRIFQQFFNLSKIKLQH